MAGAEVSHGGALDTLPRKGDQCPATSSLCADTSDQAKGWALFFWFAGVIVKNTSFACPPKWQFGQVPRHNVLFFEARLQRQ